MDRQNLGQTAIGLERYGSSPLRLELGPEFSDDALDAVLDDEGKVICLGVRFTLLDPFMLPTPHEIFPGGARALR
jgi:hypothetical protein